MLNLIKTNFNSKECISMRLSMIEYVVLEVKVRSYDFKKLSITAG